MTDSDMDTAILMARLKIQAKKHLDLSVDLEKLEQDETYAQAVLRAVEDEAEDENLLVLVLRLRARLKSRQAEESLSQAKVAPLVTQAKPTLIRDHRFGARG
ncbi:hypothetical protein E9531_10540 [Lampropedia puyangensis]|uniref:Uncharacterized protein n=1 Tax=Lampropedia puyangensis TaxID=1330072 RepID=A0A4V4GR98_9BURK|nr:hypothetical protein [Lampropedia puyangensis]THU00696.1 hypothetical protein E9531_10540 [Lampropedia puyangensis]